MPGPNREPEKRKRGRPARLMRERIDASPEEIADAVMQMPRKTKWRYLQKHGDGKA